MYECLQLELRGWQDVSRFCRVVFSILCEIFKGLNVDSEDNFFGVDRFRVGGFSNVDRLYRLVFSILCSMLRD